MLKNIKSLFFVEEEAPKPETAPENKQIPVTPPPSPKAGSTPLPLPAQRTGAGNLDERIFDSLQQALEDNNQQGFDFLEFKNSLKTLDSIIPDQAVRYKSAYATAATLGVTVQKLLDSAAFYQSVLERERENFNKAVSQQVDLNVTAKQQEAQRLQTLIQQKAEQIARLTSEITTHQEEMARAQGVITEATNKIETTKSNFYFTLDTVVNQIQTDVENIQKYLKS